MFEIIKSDLAARIGILHTNHGTVETPAYVPVLHPVKQTIPATKFKEMGFEIIITNAYLTRKNYGVDTAIERGIHKIIGFDGTVMTDSGGYQVLEYGDLNVTPQEMASFERGIKTDIAIPLDKPTGFGLSKKKATKYVKHTLKVSKETINESDRSDGQIWVGPIQGGEHFDLVKKSTKSLIDYGFEMLALGSPVEFMESYRYKLLAEMIITAKKQIPANIPLHLFGAGHPLTIPLAVAFGCDTFDSASYILYAKQGRYITEDRTSNISEMDYFSCQCEICSKNTPKEILSLDSKERVDSIAIHNLYSIKSELNRVKEAITEGRLWEYAIKKMRSHPKLFEAIDIMTKNSNFFLDTTPAFKDKAIFLFSREDQFRPEVLAYHHIVRKFSSSKSKNIICITRDTYKKPGYLSLEYSQLVEKFGDMHSSIQFCHYNPLLGLIPIELSDLDPCAHYVMSEQMYMYGNDEVSNDKVNEGYSTINKSESDEEDYTRFPLPSHFSYLTIQQYFPEFVKTCKIFFKNNRFDILYTDRNDKFLRTILKKIVSSDCKKRSI